MKDINKIIEKTNHIISIIEQKSKDDTFGNDFMNIVKTMDEIIDMNENDDLKKEFNTYNTQDRGYIWNIIAKRKI